MFVEPEVDSDDEGVMADREELIQKAQAAVLKGRSLLGGQAVEEDGDAYMTTAQRASYGIPDGHKKKSGTKKLTRASAQEISPITGEKICDYGTWAADFDTKAATANPPPKRKPAFVASAEDLRIVKMLKQSLVSRGAKGFIGLQRKFRIMDDDRSGSLDSEEFKKAMRECGLFLTAPELDRLFLFFDRDGSKTIDFEEFLLALRGDLSARRKVRTLGPRTPPYHCSELVGWSSLYAADSNHFSSNSTPHLLPSLLHFSTALLLHPSIAPRCW